MVGGEVIGVGYCKSEPEKLRVLCAEQRNGKLDLRNACYIWCETPKGGAVNLGDSLWWHGDRCYWTPRSNPEDDRRDVPLRRLSYSAAANLAR